MTTVKYFRHADDARTFAPGETVFRQGDAGATLFVVLEGQVDILVGDTRVETAESGSLVGEMALIDRRPRSATAIAATNCRLVEVDERRFLFMVQQTPHFALDVMRIMASRLRAMDSRLSSTP